MTLRPFLFLFATTVAVPALAASGDGGQTARDALGKLAPGALVSHVRPAPLPGFTQALVDGRLVYVSDDGRYVLDGRVFDVQARRNLTDRSMNAIRRKALAAVPESRRIVFAPPHPKYTVTVFTDVDCAYCRAFHHNIEAINREGIAVEYLFWPREGLKRVPSGRDTPSYAKAVAVWCAADRKQAFTEAKDGKPVPPASCPNPVADEFNLGRRIGVDGTPTIVAEDGSVIGGYLDPQQLLQAVREARGPAADGAETAQR